MLSICIPRPELGTRAEARTKEIERALAMGAEFIFMMDLDQTVPEGALDRMFYALRHGADIAVVDCPNKGQDDSNIRYHPDGTLAYATISCSLIKASLFNRLKRPWFASDVSFVEDGIKDRKIVWRVDKKYQDDNVGEDIYFIRQVIEAGMKVYVVPDMKCNHFDLTNAN